MSFQSRNRPIPHDLYASVAKSGAEPSLTLLQRAGLTFAVWRQRSAMRRRLAEMDSRSLRDAGISPAAAAYESGKPFWSRMGSLR